MKAIIIYKIIKTILQKIVQIILQEEIKTIICKAIILQLRMILKMPKPPIKKIAITKICKECREENNLENSQLI